MEKTGEKIIADKTVSKVIIHCPISEEAKESVLTVECKVKHELFELVKTVSNLANIMAEDIVKRRSILYWFVGFISILDITVVWLLVKGII